MIATGYFGVPGKLGGKVHIAVDSKPLCGSAMPKESVFQWCAHGVKRQYVECERCKSSNLYKAYP